VLVITLQELKEKLAQLDEVTLLETLEVTSEDLVNRFADYIETNYDYLSGEFDEHTPWDND
jgi:hypothetical protein